MGSEKLLALFLGQFLAFLIAMTGLTSEILAGNKIRIPLLQSFLNYLLLALFFGPIFLFKRKQLEVSWRCYLGLALLDVLANFLVIVSYQYTSLTSVALLDCFSIPSALLLSTLILKTQYTKLHFSGVSICVCGLVLVFFSDAHSQDWKEGSNFLLGDSLVILGSSLYAFSNVFEEYLVKNVPTVEILAFLGIFGSLICSFEIVVFEIDEIWGVAWSIETISAFAGFALALFLFYSLAPLMLRISGSAMFNLSLLMSDVWAIGIRAFFFHQTVDWLFFLAFGMVSLGLLIYSQGQEFLKVTQEISLQKDETNLLISGDSETLPVTN